MVEVGLGLASANPQVRRGEPGEGLHHAAQPPPPKKDPREDQEGPTGGPGKKKKNKKKKKIRVVSLKPTRTPGPTKKWTNPKGHLVRDTQRQRATTTGSPVKRLTNPKGEPVKTLKKHEETGKRLEVKGSQPPLLIFDQPRLSSSGWWFKKKGRPKGQFHAGKG